MTLELLFAQAQQGRTFLQMLLCGGAAGLLMHAGGLLRKKSRWVGAAADILCAACLAMALCAVLLQSGEGLRLYGLLGLCIGGTLYAAGIAPALGWVLKIFPANKRSTGGTER